MFECKCTKCGKMKIAPLNMSVLKQFVCWECKKKEDDDE